MILFRYATMSLADGDVREECVVEEAAGISVEFMVTSLYLLTTAQKRLCYSPW
jgi:hypothetical protein